MKKLLNTLYITSEGAWAHKDGANVVVQLEGKERGRAPLHLLGAIICFGQVGVSPQLMHACAEAGICITYLGWSGRFLARVEGPVSGNVLLRRVQHDRTLNDPLPVARAMVAAKAANQRGVLRRAIRDYGDPDGRLDAAERRLSDVARRALDAPDGDNLRGQEGEAANAYFSVFANLIRAKDMAFNGRSRRPPRDAANALLSFLYVLLAADCRAALEAVGLDPQMGFLHRDRPGRASLALDLMEEFRAPLADRLCLSLINRRQLGPRSFEYQETGGVVLSDEARKTVLTAWQERKRSPIEHVFLKEKLPFGLFPYVQAQLLARHLRGDLDGYPAFIWR
ncbi:CRISPR-associated protein Cas1 [Roseinatronobacter thiooxidans]|uniref:CRISPR-associated endonuclease Cas1 n=1 Tax=Roseinatronobacter thiooxidans TaxID=121821 RepID=A0A2W7QKY2_9RHOB|nr:type I-C CRISPR-associated endonuclease Cas1c [Roseinatronobacter thiooxidans]PZX44647.1 CRISPR-associated protein Cas1 [Roseinatronobacter thiooxidans]